MHQVQEHLIIERYVVMTKTPEGMKQVIGNLTGNFKFSVEKEWMNQVEGEVCHFALFEREQENLLDTDANVETSTTLALEKLERHLAAYEKAVQSEDEFAMTDASIAVLNGTSLSRVLSEYKEMAQALANISELTADHNLADAQYRALLALNKV